MKLARSRKPLSVEPLENRRLLAADIEILVDPYELESAGDEVTRVVRVFNNGDERADGVVVTAKLEDQLEDATWTGELGVARWVDLSKVDASSEADFKITPDRPILWQSIGDTNGDGHDDFGVWHDDRGTSAWVIFGGARHVRLDSEGPQLESGDADGPLAMQITRTSPNRPWRFAALDDVNGDGVNDFTADGRVLFGSTTPASSVELPEVELIPPEIPEEFLDPFRNLRTKRIGDINHDGFTDYGVVDGTVFGEFIAVLIGGPEEASFEMFRLSQFTSQYASTFHDAGDLNGDGIDDVLVTYVRYCDSCTSTDQDRFAGLEGIAIGLGADSYEEAILAGDRSIVLPSVNIEYPGGSVQSTATADRNADGILDLIFDDHVIFGGSNFDSFDHFSSQLFDGTNGYSGTNVRHEAVMHVDLNGDDRLDRLVHQRTQLSAFFDQGELESITRSASSETGILNEVLNIPPGTSVVYTVTGRLRQDAEPRLLAMASFPEVFETLEDNVYPRRDKFAWVEATAATQVHEVDHTQETRTVSVEIEIANKGRARARQVQLDEAVSGKMNNVTWSVQNRSEQAFTNVQELATYQAGYDRVGRNGGIERQGLGHDVGPLGDIDGDGFTDLLVDGRVYWGGEHFDFGSLVGDFGTTPIGVYRPRPLGDVNADGFDDFLSGRTIYLGGTREGIASRERIISLSEPTEAINSYFGEDLTDLFFAGDVNGDQVPDYLTSTGILLGTRDGVVRKRGNRLELPGTAIRTFGATQPLGDINSDGINDFAVSNGNARIVDIVLGGPHVNADFRVRNHVHHRLTGFYAYKDCPLCGFSQGHDVSGDGIGDIILRGSMQNDRWIEGVLVFTDLDGTETDIRTLSAEQGTFLAVPEDSETSTFRFTTAFGDFDGDRRAEIIISSISDAYLFDIEQLRGSWKVGEITNQNLHGHRFEISDRTTALFSGIDATVFTVGDINHDGIDDFITGQHAGARADNEPFAGGVGLVLGKQTVARSGTGAMPTQVFDIPVRESIIVRIEGTLPINQIAVGEIQVTVDGEQQHLFVPGPITVQVGYTDDMADLDANGVVNYADFLILSKNFGQSTTAAGEGDLDGNGVVDFTDFLLLSKSFGKTLDNE